MFNQEPCLHLDFYPMSITFLQSEIDLAKVSCFVRKLRTQQILRNGCLICMGAYKRDVVAVVKVGA